MKLFIGIVLLSVVAAALGDTSCKKEDWIDMVDDCEKAMHDQIQMEINASYQYLAMGAHFSRDTINRPGFAEHFFGAAKEEREHAQHLIEYLTMRGKLACKVSGIITSPKKIKTVWRDGVHALENALELETTVTKSIRGLIETCEGRNQKFNDYHLVDYLTGVYLEEQYKGQREIAGKLSTLKKMMDTHKEIGEFLFDKTM